jgi:hypothetical protein
MQRGEFSDLPGAGKPLPRDELSMVDEEIRMAYRILKNSGCAPPGISLRNEIAELEQSLSDHAEQAQHDKTIRKLHYLYMRLDESGMRHLNLALQDQYYGKILGRLAAT